MLTRAWLSGFAVSSNFAREHAKHVALAASDGLITTKHAHDEYGGTWRITIPGLLYLKKNREGRL